jgi:hypothetical protein
MNVIIIDIESDNLYPYQRSTWTVCMKHISGKRITINPFRMAKEAVKEQILDFIFQYDDPIITGHNILGFDLWVLWRDFGLDIHVGKDTICGRPVTFVDTLFASQFLFPDRPGHSLEDWGIRLNKHKIPYRKVALELGIIKPEENEFCRWSEQMDIYCNGDVDVNEKVFQELWPGVDSSMQAFKLGQKNFFLMNAQTFTGFKFDIDKAQALKPMIEAMMDELRREVEPGLPLRPPKKLEETKYRFPAKPWKADGSFSSHMMSFLFEQDADIISSKKVRIKGKVIDVQPGKSVIDGLPMTLDDQKELKEYFLANHWEPVYWNFKKDANGKPMRDGKRGFIKTSPKIQESGKICPNLLELEGDLPKRIVRFLSLKNRLGILEGWLSNPRIEFDGRLPAGSSGIANSFRQKHTCIVNVPKAQDDVLLGKEFRDLFTVDEGNLLIGCDQAALEARCEAHWVYEFDPDMANELIDGDIHSRNSKAFFPEETEKYDIFSPNFNKDDPGFKPYRSKSKNGKYAVTYGSSAPKLAKTLGLPEEDGERIFDAFWKANPGLKRLKDKIEWEWEKKGNKVWITGIDGRKLFSRSKHSLINLLFQSTGAIIVDYALALFDMKMGDLLLDSLGRPYYNYKGHVVKRVQYFHDEFGCEVNAPIAEEIAKIMEWCMTEAGKRLKLNVPLVGEAKVGKSWTQCH